MNKFLILGLTSILTMPVYANYGGFFQYAREECIRSNLTQYDEVQRCINHIIWAKKADKYGFVNAETGDVIVPFAYEKASKFIGNVGFVQQGLNWVAFDKEGNLLYSIIADDVKNEFYEYAKIIRHTEQGKKVGLIEKSTGKIVIPIQYDDLDNVDDGAVGFAQNNKYGFLDLNNNVIVQPIYDGVGNFVKGKSVVYKAGKSGVINKKGKLIAPFTQSKTVIDYKGTVISYKN